MPADRVHISIDGVEGELKENVIVVLSLTEPPEEGKELTEKQFINLTDKIPAEVEAALRPFGYYNPVTEVVISQTKSSWNVNVRIKRANP